MTCDLEQLFGPVVQALPAPPAGPAAFVFSPDNLPGLPPRLQSDRLILKRGEANVSFQARPATYRHLGALLMALQYQPEPDGVQLDLTHPASEIKHLLIDYPFRDANPDVGFVRRRYPIPYTPALPGLYPWVSAPPVDPDDLPVFRLGSAPDTVSGFGFEAGCRRLAELLLNLGLSDNPVRAYHLAGAAGVDAHLYLPGSDGWEALV